MNHPQAAIVFDLDGTLVDSRADIAASANFALKANGFPTHSEEAIGTFVGDGAHQLIRRASGITEQDPRFAALHACFLSHYETHAAVRTRFMPGAEFALHALRELPIALLTNKPRPPTIALLSALGRIEQFSMIIAGGDFPYLKPDPRPLQHIAHRLGVPPQRVVMVGDGPQDVECGRAAQTKTIGVLGGIASPQRLRASHPDLLIDSLAELPDALKKLGLG